MPRIDFGQIPDAQDFTPVPDGEYLCRVIDAEETMTRSGDPMWRLRFSIENGPYEGRSLFDNLALQAALPPGVPRDKKEASRWRRRGRKVPGPKDVWKDVTNRRFTSFVVSKKTLLSTGHPDATPKKPFLAALDIKTGKTLWEQALPSDAVKGGTAMDAAGRIYVALENGQLLCFEAKAE